MSTAPTLYIVHDEPLVATELRRRAAGLGCTVLGEARDLATAAAALAGKRPDAVLLDVAVARGDDAAVARLRSATEAPLVLVAADAAAARAAEGDDPLGVLIVPCDEQALRLTLRMALYWHRLERGQGGAASGVGANGRMPAGDEGADELRELFENASDLVQAVAPDGRLRFANRAWREALGLTAAELGGRNLLDFVPENERPRTAGLLAQWQRGETGGMVWLVLRARDGRRLEVEGRVSVCREGGRVVEARGLFREVGRGEGAEDALRSAHERLELALRVSRTCTWQDEVVANRLTLDPAWAAMLGRPPRETVTTSRALIATAHPDDRAAILAAARGAIYGKTDDYSVEHRVATAGGEWLWILSHGRVAERDGEGRAIRIVGTNTDITARKQAERELRTLNANLGRLVRERTAQLAESEQHYRALVENVNHGFYVANRRSLFTYCNPAVTAVTGLSAAELIGTSSFRIVVAEDRTRVISAYREWSASGATEGMIEFRIPTKSGRTIWVEQATTFVRDAAGRVLEYRNIVRDISERKLAEAALRASEERFHAVFDRSPSLIVLATLDEGRIVELNAAALKAIGYERHEAVGARSVDLGVWHDPSERDRYLALLREHGSLSDYELRLRRRNGQTFTVLATGSLIEIGGRIYSLNSMMDITARRQTELALRASEERFRLVNQAVFNVIWDQDITTGAIWWNDRFEPLFGHTPDEAGKNGDFWRACLHPADRERVLAGVRAALDSSSDTWTESYRFRRKDGSYAHVDDKARIVRDAAGRPVRMIGAMRDVTARRQAEAALRESEERFRQIADTINDVFWAADVDITKMFYISPAYERIWGRPLASLRANPRSFLDAVHPDDRERVIANLGVQQHGLPFAHEYRIVRPDGSIRWIADAGYPVREPTGEVHRYVGIARDITERKLTEAELRKSEERFYGVFVASPIPILLSELPDGRMLEANGAALESFGYTRVEVIGRTTSEIGLWVRPEQRDEFFRRLATARAVHAFEATMRTKSGVERVMLCTGAVLFVGEKKCVLTSAVDITAVRQAELERARLQERLHQNQKYEALGTLAGGVAHDFNNILTGVINYASLAREDCPATHPHVKDFLDQVLKSGMRAKELVRQILLFSRSEDAVRGPVLLQHELREVLSLLRSTLPAAVRIVSDADKETPIIQANATQIHQVVMNLSINAAHAMEGGGTLTLRVRPQTVDAALAAQLPDLRPGLHACLEVNDTGTGIAPAVLTRIFEPFFTTKKVGEGTGLGLAVVHSVVRSHHGAIAVESTVGVGTTFRLYFPAHAPKAPTLGALPFSFPPGRGQRLLVVDDEAAVAESVQMMLTRIGYRVTMFTNPGDALARFRAGPDDFDLLMADLQMPDMTGIVLAKSVHALRPALPVLIASGFPGSMTAEKMRAEGVTRFIQKPFDLAELAGAIAETLR